MPRTINRRLQVGSDHIRRESKRGPEPHPINMVSSKLLVGSFPLSNSRKKADGFGLGRQWLLRLCLYSFKRRQFSRCMAL